MKLFYFHVPKTAGSFLNEILGKQFKNSYFHIEGVGNFDTFPFHEYGFLSGHVSYTRMNEVLDLDEWTTLATFREPVSYVISHLKWVRKLADEGEEKRFLQHPKIFQDIALKMKEYDFSKAEEIKKFIAWLDSINFKYFHNTQLLYMHQTANQNNLSVQQVEKALKNLHQIDYIGIQENLDEFMDIIENEFSLNLDNSKKRKININENNYGFDINDIATREALFPLYEHDIAIYNEAKKIASEQQKLYLANGNKVIGYVDKKNDNEVIGWARYSDSLKKVNISLVLDGKVVNQTIANLYRNGLKIKKIHPTGLCEFKFIVSGNIDLSSCKVYADNYELPLSLENTIEGK